MKSGIWKYGISLLMIVGLVWFGVTAFNQSLTPYKSFREARGTEGYVQVNGTLADPEQTRTVDGMLHFDLKDEEGEVLLVQYEGVKPAKLRAGDECRRDRAVS